MHLCVALPLDDIMTKKRRGKRTQQSPEFIAPTPIDTNLALYAQPGLYKIACFSTNRVYIGETKNILERLGKHVANLQLQKSDCKLMQKDWDSFGVDNFEIRVLCMGPEYEDRDTRKQLEKEYIKQYSESSIEVYNFLEKVKEPTRNYRTIIEVDGIVYNSINIGAKALGIGETTLRRHLADTKKTNYKVLKHRDVGYSQVSINGVVYDGIVEVVKAGLAKDRWTATRRLKSTNKKWRDWFYVSRARDRNLKGEL